MKIHIKGFILQQLAASPGLWDTEIGRRVCGEYDKPAGDYWFGTVRACLADLSSGGLIQAIEDKVDAASGKLLFKYRVSDFGLARMRQTGLA